jgi:hypothetical protein
MVKIESFFQMQQGRALYANPESFVTAIKALPDGFYVNKIEKLYNKRSNPQNAYYWGVVCPLVRDGLMNVGYECNTVDEAHEFLKNEFIILKGKKRKRLVNKNTGELKYVKIFPSTKQLTTIEFNDYFERIIRWASEYLDVEIPYPNETIDNGIKNQYQGGQQ